jgi:hypothetical protein
VIPRPKSRLGAALVTLALLHVLACAQPRGPAPQGPVPDPVVAEAGFVEAPARTVMLQHGPASIDATARLFHDFRPADESPESAPIVVLFNGFADDIVRAYGTGPTTVAMGGDVVDNPASLTRFANLLYVEPRQAGYSYDVLAGRPPEPADCSPDVFNEYVDAADVLFGVLAFLQDHPRLQGPVYWLGESYGGVRITWILAYLRGRWDLVPYADPVLGDRIASVHRTGSLAAGQILLEAWLAGGAEAAAIAAACHDPVLMAGIAAAVGGGSCGTDACTCATENHRSFYNYSYTVDRQNERVAEADLAHVLPDRASALLGVPLAAIAGLGATERGAGFKCSAPDETVPSDAALVAELGPLPAGQSYFVPYSPLEPGKETSEAPLDWRTLGYQPIAFADNLRDVPTFLTQGDRDLVVPTLALAPALVAALGAGRVDTQAGARLGVRYPDGERFVDIFEYPDAGHMVSMVEGAELAADLEAWLPSTR